MKISIVTISFNQAPFLEATLRSVVDQDYPDVEYIVVDPGSTDGSGAILDRYRDRIANLVREKDSGPSEGLTHGFAVATGEIFGFLNSDDLLSPGALSRVAARFAADPDLQILSGHVRVIDHTGARVRNSYSDRFDVKAFAYGACSVCQPSTFFRRDLYRQSRGFNLNNTVSWDGELFLDLHQLATKAEVIDDFLSSFRIHPGSITAGGRQGATLRRFKRQRFEAIMGRPWRPLDGVAWGYYRVRKYLLEPRSLIERVTRGSIFRRYGRPAA